MRGKVCWEQQQPRSSSHNVSQCDNQRPFCRKCIDGGRECAGYERETVFIIGTVEDRGRCSSHPPRVLKAKKGRAATSNGDGADRLELIPKEPLRPAWDDLVAVVCRGKSYRLQVASVYTNLQAVKRGDGDHGAGDKSIFSVSFPPYEPSDAQSGSSHDDFQLSSRCLVHLAAPDDNATATDSICLFLYEVGCLCVEVACAP